MLNKIKVSELIIDSEIYDCIRKQKIHKYYTIWRRINQSKFGINILKKLF